MDRVYSMLQTAHSGGRRGDAVVVDNDAAFIVNRNPAFAERRMMRIMNGASGFSYPASLVEPFVVRAAALDPRPVGAANTNALWETLECGFCGDNMNHVPFFKIRGADAYVPLDAHVKISFEAK
jgi:hypothetical protein